MEEIFKGLLIKPDYGNMKIICDDGIIFFYEENLSPFSEFIKKLFTVNMKEKISREWNLSEYSKSIIINFLLSVISFGEKLSRENFVEILCISHKYLFCELFEKGIEKISNNEIEIDIEICEFLLCSITSVYDPKVYKLCVDFIVKKWEKLDEKRKKRFETVRHVIDLAFSYQKKINELQVIDENRYVIMEVISVSYNELLDLYKGDLGLFYRKIKAFQFRSIKQSSWSLLVERVRVQSLAGSGSVYNSIRITVKCEYPWKGMFYINIYSFNIDKEGKDKNKLNFIQKLQGRTHDKCYRKSLLCNSYAINFQDLRLNSNSDYLIFEIKIMVNGINLPAKNKTNKSIE